MKFHGLGIPQNIVMGIAGGEGYLVYSLIISNPGIECHWKAGNELGQKFGRYKRGEVGPSGINI